MKKSPGKDCTGISQLTNQPNYEKSSLFHVYLVEGLLEYLRNFRVNAVKYFFIKPSNYSRGHHWSQTGLKFQKCHLQMFYRDLGLQ